MDSVQFEVDYGRIPSAFFAHRRISNPGELLWSDALCGLLRLCGISEREIGETASDYERFLALCKVVPMLKGHPTVQDLSAFLNTYFDASLPLCSENCDALWRTLVQQLENQVRTPFDFLPQEPVACLVPDLVPPPLPMQIAPMLDAEALLSIPAASMEAWSEEIQSTLRHFVNAGCKTVRFVLPFGYLFVTPTVYHVQEALKVKKQTSETDCLLRSQLFRALCESCQALSMRLLMHVECAATEAEALLHYAEGSVGLPILYWSARGVANDTLLRYQMQKHIGSLYWVLRLSELPSDVELEAALAYAVARYPITRLRFVCDCDLRMLSAARTRLAQALQKTL